MMFRCLRVLMTLAVIGLWQAAASGAPPGPRSQDPFELKNGDRVVFLGSNLIEKAQVHGYIELALTTRWPGRNIVFRNLGWSGDTVHGEAWSHFTRPPSAFERLVNQVKRERPTVIFIGYGTNEAAGGEQEMARFTEGLNRLLDMLAETEARIVLLSPVPQEVETSPAPQVAERHNEALKRITGEIERVARARGCRFLDLFTPVAEIRSRFKTALTTDGVQFNGAGYYALASVIEAGLGLPKRTWNVSIDARRERIEASGAVVSGWKAGADGSLQFTLRDDLLPMPALDAFPPALVRGLYDRKLSVAGLPGGRYLLMVDRVPVATASAEEWARGVALLRGPAQEQAEQLRRLIVKKDWLYFQQYRPTNITYILGFRKYEQGRHAEELDRFTPLIDERENEIGRLRVPSAQQYRLVRVEENTSGL